LSKDRMTAFSRPSRFGMTFAPLTDDLGMELLTWFQAGFLARTLALPEKAKESPENDQDYGPTWRGSLAKFDPDTLSWKTVQLSLLGDSELSSVTWPRSGMTANGQCWELPTLGRRTEGTGFGYWPTPNTIGYRSDGELAILARVLDDETEFRAMTHRAAESKRKKAWPAPTVCGNYNRKGASATNGTTLAGYVRMFPTATAVRKWATPRKQSANGTGPSRMGNREDLQTQAGGSLNPTWVEWLMGWKLGWTDLKPLAMDKCHCARQQHGES
jgi:hypothetical protein